MDPRVQRLLLAIDRAEEANATDGRRWITAEHARDVAAVMAWPSNQDGADKSHVWLEYVQTRLHYATAKPTTC
jgi:hypothetical protein